MDRVKFPALLLSFSKKNKKWRKECVDWADSKNLFNSSLVRNNVMHKKINYDLSVGIIHMKDIERIVNPDNIDANFIPDKIQHYPIINSKLHLLQGEESARVFDYKVIVTNPDAVSDIELIKKQEILAKITELVQNQSMSDEEFQRNIEAYSDYFLFEYLDIRELRANCLLNHYSKELNFKGLFNEGFWDAMVCAEEIYLCDIVGGEPILEKLNPMKLRVYKSGYSSNIEDADILVYEDYWSPGKVFDYYYDVLTNKDREYLNNAPEFGGYSAVDSAGNFDPRAEFIHKSMVDEEVENNPLWNPFGSNAFDSSLMPYDMVGNIRVIRVYWKSRRKIKKVKHYNQETGETEFDFYSEEYRINKDLGEEEEIFWVNEAWEGTKIGESIYVNMRPRVVLYNTLTNPSRCHFGIVGSIYNHNQGKPYSLLDMMKLYNYLYDVIHDRLNKVLSRNYGKLIKLDFALVPDGWNIEQWLYYAKTNNLFVVDSFKEGKKGAATGKLAAALNNNSNGVVDAELGNIIQLYTNLLEYIKGEMSEITGISKQREGLISNRETVGGVERSTLQSSHITEWLFIKHDDVKRRVLNCFLETAKAALKGRNLKFDYILPSGAKQLIEIEGDEFAENDYGLAVDNSEQTQKLAGALDSLVQAGILNQAISFYTAFKMYSSCSIAEKARMIQKNELEIQQRQQEQLQQQNELLQLQLLQLALNLLMLMEHQDKINQRDNDTRVVVAEINSLAELAVLKMKNNLDEDGVKIPEDMESLKEKMREFDAKLKLDKEKLEFEKQKHKDDVSLKKAQNAKSSNK